jgi:uncharacterized cupin superfamily protein
VREVANLFAAPRARDDDDPAGFEVPYVRIGPLLGAAGLGMSVYELAQGQSICPYHYEYPDEEWLLVLEGTPTVRDPAGETVLEPGDLVAFPVGPDGAHKVSNHAAGTALVAMLSTRARTAVAVYPDSDKIGVWSGDGEVKHLFPRTAAVDYWHGELPSPGGGTVT